MLSSEDLLKFVRAVGDHAALNFSPNYWIPFGLEWVRWENTEARFNPFATTDSSLPNTLFNDSAVKNYSTFADGVEATVRTLAPGYHYSQYTDYYSNIRRAIRLQSIDLANRSLVIAEMRQWGTTGFANLIQSGWNPPNVQIPPTTSGLSVEALNEAIQKRMALIRLANDPDLSKVELAYNQLKFAKLLD